MGWNVALPGSGAEGRRVQAKAREIRELDSLAHTEQGFWVLETGSLREAGPYWSLDSAGFWGAWSPPTSETIRSSL